MIFDNFRSSRVSSFTHGPLVLYFEMEIFICLKKLLNNQQLNIPNTMCTQLTVTLIISILISVVICVKMTSLTAELIEPLVIIER